MPLDLSQGLGLLGTIVGSGNHAGVLAGLGDAAHEQNQRDFQARADAKKAFADQLEKIGMDTDNWSEGARVAAMHARVQALSSPKGHDPKFQQQLLGQVLEASRRGGGSGMQPEAAPHAAAPLAASSGAEAQPVDKSGTMPGESGRLSVLAPPAASAAAPLPNAGNVTGPFTPAEKSWRQFDAMQPFLRAYSGGAGSDAASTGTPRWKMTVGPHGPQWTQDYPSYTSEEHRLVDASGREYTGTVLMDHDTGKLFDANTHRELAADGVRSLGKLRSANVVGYDTVGADGRPERAFGYNTDLAGQHVRKPVRLDVVKTAHGGKIEQFNRDPYTGATEKAPFAAGTTPNRDLAEQGLDLRQQANTRAEEQQSIRRQANARQQGAYDYSYGATAIDVDGSITGTPGAIFTPQGTPVDESGTPIPGKTYSQTHPTAAAITRARVAGDASVQVQRVLDRLKSADMQGDFGPLRGRALGWLVHNGIIAEPDIAALQDSMLASLASLNPAVHQMRNFQVAEDIAKRLGELGQPYENFVAKLDEFKALYDQVATSGKYPVAPGAAKRVVSRPAATSPRRPANARSHAATAPPTTDENAKFDAAIARLQSILGAP